MVCAKPVASPRLSEIYDLKKYGLEILSEHDPDNPALYWYWINPKAVELRGRRAGCVQGHARLT